MKAVLSYFPSYLYVLAHRKVSMSRAVVVESRQIIGTDMVQISKIGQERQNPVQQSEVHLSVGSRPGSVWQQKQKAEQQTKG